MKLKKNPKADINRKSNTLLAMGLMAAFAFTLVSFEWKSFHEVTALNDIGDDIPIMDEIILQAKLEKPKVKKAVVKKKKSLNTILLLDEDDGEEDDDEVEKDIIDIDDDDNLTITDLPDIDEEGEWGVEEPIKASAAVQPSFPGGSLAFHKYLADNIEYPDLAMETNTQGKVYVKFAVRKDGTIDKVHVLKGIGAGCDEEAMRVLKSVPKWKPGENAMGQPVDVWFTVPINFTINDGF